MLSGHYAGTYGHEWGWAILGLLALVGAAIRHVFNLRNKGRLAEGYWFAAAGCVGMAALLGIWLVGARGAADASGPKVAFAEAEAIIAARCSGCHSARPTVEGFEEAPKGVMYDTPRQIKARARDIAKQAIRSDVMPPGNMTEMTKEERRVLGRWIAQGAPID